MKQMKPTILLLFAALALGALLPHFLAPIAWAQDAPAVSVGVLDFEHVFRKSKAGSGLITTVQNSQKKLDDEAKATQKKLRDDNQKIQEECKTLSADECRGKMEKFAESMRAAEDALNGKRKALEKRLVDGKNQIVKALEPIVKKMIDDRKLTLVIDRAAVVYGDPKYDLTKDALKSLDASLKSL
jgi:Skp family chaperone for outer membrane proteins